MKQVPTGWSIPIKETDRVKTAFVSPRGEFEFGMMPFGFCNALSTYQRMLDLALKDAPQSSPYIDDTLTFSNSFDEHLKHLRVVLQCYRSANLQLRIDNCRFWVQGNENFGIFTVKTWIPLTSIKCCQNQVSGTTIESKTAEVLPGTS